MWPGVGLGSRGPVSPPTPSRGPASAMGQKGISGSSPGPFEAEGILGEDPPATPAWASPAPPAVPHRVSPNPNPRGPCQGQPEGGSFLFYSVCLHMLRKQMLHMTLTTTSKELSSATRHLGSVTQKHPGRGRWRVPDPPGPFSDPAGSCTRPQLGPQSGSPGDFLHLPLSHLFTPEAV